MSETLDDYIRRTAGEIEREREAERGRHTEFWRKLTEEREKDAPPPMPDKVKCYFCPEWHEYAKYNGMTVVACPEVPDGDPWVISPSAFEKAFQSLEIATGRAAFNDFARGLDHRENMHMFGDGDGSEPVRESVGVGAIGEDRVRVELTDGRVTITEPITCANPDQTFAVKVEVERWPCEQHIPPYMNESDRTSCEICGRGKGD